MVEKRIWYDSFSLHRGGSHVHTNTFHVNLPILFSQHTFSKLMNLQTNLGKSNHTFFSYIALIRWIPKLSFHLRVTPSSRTLRCLAWSWTIPSPLGKGREVDRQLPEGTDIWTGRCRPNGAWSERTVHQHLASTRCPQVSVFKLTTFEQIILSNGFMGRLRQR